MNEISVGKIVKPQGILGEVKIFSYFDDTKIFCLLKKIRIAKEKEFRNIEKIRAQGEFVFVKLEGLSDRNSVDLLRYQEVFALREDVKQLLGEETLVEDVIGMKIVGLEETGFVLSIEDFGAGDVMTAKFLKRECMFPIVDGIIEEIDEKSKQIRLSKKIFEEVVVWQDEN